MEIITETKTNIIAEDTRIDGDVKFRDITRVHGTIHGKIYAEKDSVLILGETAVIEGEIHADTIVIDGYVKGNVFAEKKITVSNTGRVVGDLRTPLFEAEFGAFLDGNCVMEDVQKPTPILRDPSLSLS